MKCKTCKYWNNTSFGLGTCNGLNPEFKVFSLPSVIDKKGNQQKRGKLVQIRSGVIGVSNPITPQDFYCKNWSKRK